MGGSDKRLVKRAARGDGRAFEEIYRRYGQDLYRFCLAMTANPQDAQDALQNTMVKVLRALPGEERQIVLKPWLYRIARNETVDVLRKRRDNEELGGQLTTVNTVAETAEVREHLRTLLGDLEQLPQRQRAVLLMRELSGLGFAEIAVAFGTSAGAVRQTLYEARISLQQLQEGRERRCADVQRELSDADGRVIRRRKTRAHLRSCGECLAFYNEMTRRQEGLAAIAALPLAVSTGLLRDALAGQAGSIAGSVAGTGAAGAGIGAATSGGIGNALVVSAVTKSAATLAVAALAVSAADRGGLVELPLRGEHDHPASSGSGAAALTTGAARRPFDRSGPADLGLPVTKRKTEVTGAGRDAAEVLTGSPEAHPAGQGSSQAESRPAAVDNQESGTQADSTEHPDGDAPSSPSSQRPEAPRPDPPATQVESSQGSPGAAADGQETAAAYKPPQADSPPAPPSAPPTPPAKPDTPPGKPEVAAGAQGAAPGKSAAHAHPPGPPHEPPGSPPDSPGQSGEKVPPPDPEQSRSSGKR